MSDKENSVKRPIADRFAKEGVIKNQVTQLRMRSNQLDRELEVTKRRLSEAHDCLRYLSMCSDTGEITAVKKRARALLDKYEAELKAEDEP